MNNLKENPDVKVEEITEDTMSLLVELLEMDRHQIQDLNIFTKDLGNKKVVIANHPLGSSVCLLK